MNVNPGYAAGGSATASDHIPVEVDALGNFVRLLSGYAGEQSAYHLLPREARELGVALIEKANEIESPASRS